MSKYPNLNDCCIAVIGLGYVGLPLALEFARRKSCNITGKSLNRKIIGFDSNNLRIRELLSNHDRTGETNPDELANVKNLIFTEKKELLKCVTVNSLSKNRILDADIKY